MGFRLWGTTMVLGLAGLILVIQSWFGDTAAIIFIVVMGIFLLVKSYMGWDKVMEPKDKKHQLDKKQEDK